MLGADHHHLIHAKYLTAVQTTFIGQYWIRKDRVHSIGTRCKKQAKGCFRHFKGGIPVRGVPIYNNRGVLISDNLHALPTQLTKSRFVMERDRWLNSWQLTHQISGICTFLLCWKICSRNCRPCALWGKVKQIWGFGEFVETYIMGCSTRFPRKTKAGELIHMNYETWHEEKSGHKR